LATVACKVLSCDCWAAVAATAEMRSLMADVRLFASWRASLEAKFKLFNVSRMLSMRALMDLTTAPCACTASERGTTDDIF